MKKMPIGWIFWGFVLFIVIFFVQIGKKTNSPSVAPPPSNTRQADEYSVETPKGMKEPEEGKAVAIVLDTSGSMGDSIKDTDGQMTQKINIAKRSAVRLINSLDKYNKKKKFNFYAGLYTFNDSGTGVKTIKPISEFNREELVNIVNSIPRPDGGTPLGMCLAKTKRDLDKANIKEKYILVVTDGINTVGEPPNTILKKIKDVSPDVGVYFVAFDISGGAFKDLKENGAFVIEARSPAQLDAGLDYLLYKKILAEDLPETK